MVCMVCGVATMHPYECGVVCAVCPTNVVWCGVVCGVYGVEGGRVDLGLGARASLII